MLSDKERLQIVYFLLIITSILIHYNVFRLGNEKTLKGLEELGLLSDQPVPKCGSPLDAVSSCY